MATWSISAKALNAIPANVIPLSAEQIRDDSEQGFVQRAQAGDGQAFAALFQLHKNRVYSVCLRMTNNEADAEDMTQEAFLQAFRKVKCFRGDSAFSTWLHRIAVNTVLMKMRRRKSQPFVSLDTPISAESPSPKGKIGKADPSLSGTVDRIVLRRAIEELPRGYRHIFNLHEVEGYQHREIAQLLQCSIGTSKSQLYKAKMKMRHLLFTKINRHRPCSRSLHRLQSRVQGALVFYEKSVGRTADSQERIC
jgi:RNA polymerase sigma-70 factor (ECF subfamily)